MRRYLLATSIGLSLLSTACIDEASGPEVAVETDLQLLSSVTRESGSVVEFYRSGDGTVMLAESGPIGSGPALTPQQAVVAHPLAVYRALTGGGEAPAALVAATQDAAGDPDAVLTLERPEAAITKARGCSKRWFIDTVCDELRDNEFQWCSTDRGDDDSRSENDVNLVWAVACADEGDVELQARTRHWWDWDTTTWMVEQGWYRAWWLPAGNKDFDFQSRVRNTAGDNYHHAGHGCSDAFGVDRCWASKPL